MSAHPSPNPNHDLRTPMNHILGYSDLLMEEAEDRGQAARLLPLLSQIQSLGKQLVRDLSQVFMLHQIDQDLDRLAVARPELERLAGQIQQLAAELHSLIERELPDMAEFLPDVQRIHSAVSNFIQLIDHFLHQPND